MNKIEVSNLNLYYDYGEKHTLKEVALSIKEKEVTALIGPSGCGKSTFIRTLNRMNDLIDGCKIDGDIVIDLQDIYDPRTDVINLRTKVGMVFQKANPFPMSIYNNVAYGLRCQGIKDKRVLDDHVIEALKKAALYEEVKDNLNASALSLSGGQQQRLCIARAIALEPEIILMDEPTSALDPIATQKIEQLIEDLKKNYTIVIVTHSMLQAKRISDQTIFFLNGEVIESGRTEQIFNNPHDQRTSDYIAGKFG